LSLFSDLRKGREIAKFGEEIAMVLIRIGRALFHGDQAGEQEAHQILETRVREQTAGRAAHRASSEAGRTVQP
jgi:hypothetical protein